MNDVHGVSRTQDEILARIEAVKSEDWMGFHAEVLVDALDFEHAKPFLKDGVTAEEWESARVGRSTAAGYLEFAIGKIQGHRGISASRSVDKLTEFAWLAGRDDVVAAMEAARYEQYGAPKVRAFAVGMGLQWPDDPELERMAQGLPCKDACPSGCVS